MEHRTFLFESAALNFFHRSIFFCHVNSSKLFDVSFWERMKIIRKNLCKAFFTIWWILLLKTFWWKILENHFKNIPRATLYVNKRAILLILDRTSRKSVRAKDLFELKKGTAQNWEVFFLESKIRYRTRYRPGGLRFSIISFRACKKWIW